MNTRLVVYLIMTIVAFFLFLFEPMFNFGNAAHLSLYEQFLRDGNLSYVVIKLSLICFMFFAGLLFLFGLKGKNKTNNND